MAKFYDFGHGRSINYDLVRKIEERDGKKAAITWSNGDEEIIDMPYVLDLGRTVISAEPGWQLLCMDLSDEGCGDLDYEPIIGWAVQTAVVGAAGDDYNAPPHPVTISRVYDDAAHLRGEGIYLGLVNPKGRITICWDSGPFYAGDLDEDAFRRIARSLDDKRRSRGVA